MTKDTLVRHVAYDDETLSGRLVRVDALLYERNGEPHACAWKVFDRTAGHELITEIPTPDWLDLHARATDKAKAALEVMA